MEILDDEEINSVVAAALAWIDDVDHIPTTTPRRTRHDRLWLLREQIDELECVLAQRQFGVLDGSSPAALWAQVAANQCQERAKALKENAVLRDCVQTVHAYAQDLRNRIETWCQRTYPEIKNTVFPSPRPLVLSFDRNVLTTRLDIIARHASRNWLGLLPTVGPEFRQRAIHLNETGEILVFQSLYASYMPFKLSLVASELWALMLHATYGTDMISTTIDEVPNKTFGEIVHHLSLSPSSRLEARGSSALGRVFTADGTVVLANATMSAGPVVTNNGDISTEAYEMHEVEWLRLGRTSTTSALIYIESVTYIEIKSVDPNATSDTKLQCIGEALRRECERVGVNNVQRLENRLLDILVTTKT